MSIAKRGFYGIDLGTTHTVVVKATKEGTVWKCVRLELPNMPINDIDNVKKTELLPSVVYFKEDGTACVGEYAKKAIEFAPERVYINAKIDLGGTLNSPKTKYHTPVEVSAEILKVCFSEIVSDGGEKASVRISVPAAFSQDKRSDTETAAKQALFDLGFKDINLVRTTEEPYAALVNLIVNEKRFIEMIKREKNTIMLIDIGGGTMDIIICDISDQGNNTLNATTPYEPAKHDEFAGAKFDFELMKKFMTDFLNYYEISGSEIPESERIILEKKLLLLAEDVKKTLCDKNNKSKTYEFTCNFDDLRINLNGKAPFKISMTKKQMDIALEGLLNNSNTEHQSIKSIIEKTLLDNNIRPSNIDCVYLTGGMANYDKIYDTIKRVIPSKVIIAEEPLFCTANGVALSAVIQTPDGKSEINRALSGQLQHKNIETDNTSVTLKQTSFKDENKTVESICESVINISEAKRMGISYFIDIEDKMPIEIISKNETFPCLKKKSKLQLKTSSQSRLNLTLYEGHSIYDCNMRILRQKTVEFDEIVPVGTAIDISYEIDANKIITIYASIDGEPPFKFDTAKESN